MTTSKIETVEQMEQAIRADTMTVEQAEELRDLWMTPDAVVYDNESESAYRIGIGNDEAIWIDCDQGSVVNVEIGPFDAISHMREYDTGDLDLAEYLSAGGLDGLSTLVEAAEDHAGPCRIWVSYNYYNGTCGAPTDGYLRDDDGEIVEYETGAEAWKAKADRDDAPSEYDGILARNVLSHGQAGSDTWTVVQA